jgi:hypothetical protein
MATTFHQTKATVSLANFLENTSAVKSFTSSRGQRYQVLRIEYGEMFFLRSNAKSSEEWSINIGERLQGLQRT